MEKPTTTCNVVDASATTGVSAALRTLVADHPALIGNINRPALNAPVKPVLTPH